MTDYLAQLLEAGSLREEVKKADWISTAGEKSVEKQKGHGPPLLAQVRKTEEILHRQRQNTPRPRPGAAEVFHTLPRPVDSRPGAEGLRPFPPLSPFERQTGRAEAEAVDRAFQRDSRRYDGGFFLY